ncbi:MAG: EamA family transporter [Actinomycetota bacterium]|nr:EamA family transporter [Actinomycetota bacterium]
MTIQFRQPKAAPSWQVWAGLWTVYLVWGSTYVAIRVVVETIPPFLGAGARFISAGLVMLLWLGYRRGWEHLRVSVPELGSSALVSTALLLGGNGVVTIAEQKGAPSSIAALIIASVPLWVVLWRVAVRDRVGLGTLAGVIVGFSGVALLVARRGGDGQATTFALLLLVFAAGSWATGSFFSRKLPLPADPFVSTTMQMLTGGIIILATGIASGERLSLSAVSGASLAGWLYLVFAGSILAFTAYVWLLQHAPISRVATYAYVNPIVAIVLGSLILNEEITVTMLVGAAVIVLSVAFIVRTERVPQPQEEVGPVVAPRPIDPTSEGGAAVR